MNARSASQNFVLEAADAEVFARHARQADYDRFLASLASPRMLRPALWVLIVWNAELARAATASHESMISAMRLSFWRDALQEIVAGQNPRAHPLLGAIARLLACWPDAAPVLATMVEARAQELEEGALATDDAWLAYLDNTSGAMLTLWCMLHGQQESAGNLQALGRAYGMVGLARAIPFMWQSRLLLLPKRYFDAVQKNYGTETLAPPHMVAGKIAEQLYVDAKSLLSNKPSVVCLRLIRKIACLRLHQIQQYRFDPYDDRLRRTPVLLWIAIVHRSIIG